MRTNLGTIATLVVGLTLFPPATRAAVQSPAEEYAALLKEYNPVSGSLRRATSDAERKAVVERMSEYPARFLALAETYRDVPTGLVAMRQSIQAMGNTDSAALTVWELNQSDFPTGGDGEVPARTVDVLRRDSLLSDAIVPVLDRLRYSYRLESGDFLRAVLEKNPHREVRGAACLFLGRFLNDRLRALQLAEDRPELVERYRILFGEEYLPTLRRWEEEGLDEEIEALFERAADEYADVAVPIGGAVGPQAESELYEIRHLAVGKMAPDIKGPDQDGVDFALSDYRGKVVLLYFWVEF